MLSNLRKKGNVKVRNATPTEVDGIKFKSKLEGYTYLQLKKADIEAEYESTHFTLIPAFIFNNEKIRKMTYLPDFVGKDFIIECKGMMTDSFPLRWKVFKYMLHLTGVKYELYLVRNHKDVDRMIENLKTKQHDA